MQNQALFGFFFFMSYFFRSLVIIEMFIMVIFRPGTEECTPILIHVLDVCPKLYMYKCILFHPMLIKLHSYYWVLLLVNKMWGLTPELEPRTAELPGLLNSFSGPKLINIILEGLFGTMYYIIIYSLEVNII